jgi:SAM-dependent methyltransferase
LSSKRARRWIKRQRWFVPMSRVLFGNDVYSESYYAELERLENPSVQIIADWIVRQLAPRRAIDVGCGSGNLMAALQERRVTVFGVDVAEAALRRCAERGVSAQRFDLTGDAPLPGLPYDVAISCEVAEHLDEKHADRFLAHLAAAASVIYMTAAEPNPVKGVGLCHVNERPNAYWIEKMHLTGWRFDEAATTSAREHFAGRVIGYLARPMVFRKN